MAKPNYSFEKRQRELAKKKKKEEKVREKAGRKVGDAPGADGAPEGDAGEEVVETAVATPATGSSPMP